MAVFGLCVNNKFFSLAPKLKKKREREGGSWFEVKLKARETKAKIRHPTGEDNDRGISVSPNSSWVAALAQDDLTRRRAERGVPVAASVIIRRSVTRRNWEHLSSTVYKPLLSALSWKGGGSWVQSQTSKGGMKHGLILVLASALTEVIGQIGDDSKFFCSFCVLIICIPWEKIVQKIWPRFLNGFRMTKNIYLKVRLLLSTKIIPCSIAHINLMTIKLILISYAENSHFFFAAHITSVFNLM